MTSSNRDITALLRWNRTGLTVAGIPNQSGNASNQLYHPFGLYLDWENTLYITDGYNSRIQKYTKDASFGETVAGQSSGINGSEAAYLNYPRDVQVDIDGNIYVADSQNNRIQLWKKGATKGVTIAGKGLFNNSTEQIFTPYGMKRHPVSNAIYVTDYLKNRILYFAPGNTFGIVAIESGNNNQLFGPMGFCIDVNSNSFLIANYLGNNTVRWNSSASTWAPFTTGISSLVLVSPTDLTVDPMGNIYVVDHTNHQLLFFPVGVSNDTIIAGSTGLKGHNATLLDYPSSIVLDNQLNIYIADLFNHRVQKFMRY